MFIASYILPNPEHMAGQIEHPCRKPFYDRGKLVAENYWPVAVPVCLLIIQGCDRVGNCFCTFLSYSL